MLSFISPSTTQSSEFSGLISHIQSWFYHLCDKTHKRYLFLDQLWSHPRKIISRTKIIDSFLRRFVTWNFMISHCNNIVQFIIICIIANEHTLFQTFLWMAWKVVQRHHCLQSIEIKNIYQQNSTFQFSGLEIHSNEYIYCWEFFSFLIPF